ISQTLLKASLPLITGGGVWVAIPLALVFVLNVRSVMLAYILSLAVTHRNIFLKKRAVRNLMIVGLPLLILVSMNIDWIEVYNRVVFKGRDVADAGSVGDAMASGRFT